MISLLKFFPPLNCFSPVAALFLFVVSIFIFVSLTSSIEKVASSKL